MISWRTFVAGAVVAAVGRPLLVSLVKTGLTVQALAADALEQARNETAKIQAEAAGLRAAKEQSTDSHADLVNEIRQLRAEFAELQAKA